MPRKCHKLVVLSSTFLIERRIVKLSVQQVGEVQPKGQLFWYIISSSMQVLSRFSAGSISNKCLAFAGLSKAITGLDVPHVRGMCVQLLLTLIFVDQHELLSAGTVSSRSIHIPVFGFWMTVLLKLVFRW